MKLTTTTIAVSILFVAAIPSVPAMALNGRSFVSPSGSDSNPCTLALPCRNLQAALYQTNPGGEIGILGTAGYSGGATLTIDRAISIVNPGAFEAGISPPSGSAGIVINAGVNDVVSLRGLTIDGLSSGTHGILFSSGAFLTVENCVVRHFSGVGIDFFPNAASNLAVSNTVVANNGGDGIVVEPIGAGVVAATFNHVEVYKNNHGIWVQGVFSTGTVNATVSESIVAHNAGIGYYAFSSASQAPTTFTVFHSVVANNSTGLVSIGVGATLRTAQSMVTGNASVWQVAGFGVLATYGDNYFDGNGAGSGTTTPISKQ